MFIECYFIGQLTNTRRSDGTLESHGALRTVTRKKFLHYHQLYIDHPEPIVFLPVTVDTSDRIYDDFSRHKSQELLNVNLEASVLANEIPEESEQFRFLRAVCYTNIDGSVGLILTKDSAMRIFIPLDLSSRSFTPHMRGLSAFRTPHSFNMTFLTLGLRPFLFIYK
jgi:hypothetical protein